MKKKPKIGKWKDVIFMSNQLIVLVLVLHVDVVVVVVVIMVVAMEEAHMSDTFERLLLEHTRPIQETTTTTTHANTSKASIIIDRWLCRRSLR